MKQRELKSEFVYTNLKEMILTHELKQGSPLSERKISLQFDASRTPVREALKRLQKEHFVDIIPEYGALVSRINFNTIIEVYEIREVLEGLSARLCAIGLNKNEKNKFKSIYRNLRDALIEKRFDDAIAYDLEFHGFIVDHANNIMLGDMIKTVIDHSQRITRLIDYTDEWLNTVLIQHFNLVCNIITGDFDNAEISMREHISASRIRQLEQLK